MQVASGTVLENKIQVSTTEIEKLSTYSEIISKREKIVLKILVNGGKGKRGQI